MSVAMISIAVDAMGGDHGPKVIVPAVLDLLKERPKTQVILVGDESLLRQQFTSLGAGLTPQLRIQHASQTVEMDEPPGLALRNKKDSSMRVGLNLLKEGQVSAFVSAGNTGALMATARFVLKTVPGIDRPAISTRLPTMTGFCHMLDLGANLECTQEHLFQFAVMGSMLASVNGHDRPKVGLLNVGHEEIKGNDEVKAASRLLLEHPSINYIGFVEGDDIFKGTADVIVCDGFVGNIALKTSEGLTKMLAMRIRDAFTASWRARLAALLAAPVLKKVSRQLDPRIYNGASLVGLRGVVIKSHGGADRMAFLNALKYALDIVPENIPDRIESQLASFQNH